jgi:hypothetical protein
MKYTTAKKNIMSNLSEKVWNMTAREIEDAEWKAVFETLLAAKERFKEAGLGNQSWLDGAIGIAESRSKQTA